MTPEPGKTTRPIGRHSSSWSLRRNGTTLAWRAQSGLKTIYSTLRASAQQAAIFSAPRGAPRAGAPCQGASSAHDRAQPRCGGGRCAQFRARVGFVLEGAMAIELQPVEEVGGWRRFGAPVAVMRATVGCHGRGPCSDRPRTMRGLHGDDTAGSGAGPHPQAQPKGRSGAEDGGARFILCGRSSLVAISAVIGVVAIDRKQPPAAARVRSARPIRARGTGPCGSRSGSRARGGRRGRADARLPLAVAQARRARQSLRRRDCGQARSRFRDRARQGQGRSVMTWCGALRSRPRRVHPRSGPTPPP